MEQNEKLFLKSQDYLKITALLASAPEEIRDLLQSELDRATVAADDRVPEGVVTMHSLVEYIDVATKKSNRIRLVYPHEVNIEESKISVLAPIGAALIGLKVGQKIKWPLPNGREKVIEVTSVTQELDAAS